MTIRGFVRGRSAARGLRVGLSPGNSSRVRLQPRHLSLAFGAFTRLFAVAGVAIAAGAPITPVAAADLGGYDDPPDYVAEEFSWTGLYFGAHAGYGWGDFGVDLTYSSGAIHYNDPFVPPERDLGGGDGWLGGFQAGGNKQFGSVVLGLEADVSWTGMDASGTFVTEPGHACGAGGCTEWTITSKIDVMGTVRGRIGFTPTERLLLYGTGGLAWAIMDVDQASQHNPPDYVTDGGRTSGSPNHIGWAAGAGAEWAFANHWTLKAEYLYVDLGSEDYALTGTTTPGGSVPYVETFSGDVKAHTVKVGINYLFN